MAKLGKSNTIKHHERFEEFCLKNNKSKIEFAIEFAKVQTLIDAVTIGISKKEDLVEILGLWDKTTKVTKDVNWSDWSLNDPAILDPRLWPKN